MHIDLTRKEKEIEGLTK